MGEFVFDSHYMQNLVGPRVRNMNEISLWIIKLKDTCQDKKKRLIIISIN